MVPFRVAAHASVLIAPASMKGSLTAEETAAAMAAGVRSVLPDAVLVLLPLADGGEGIVSVLTEPFDLVIRHAIVQGPLSLQQVDAVWGLSRDGSTAVIEMAAAAGLSLVPPNKRDPRFTTTFGVGQLLSRALDAGATRIIVGLGGSATNDGGAGMAEALGVIFRNSEGRTLPRGGAALCNLSSIDCSGIDPRLKTTTIIAACDVSNPLLGAEGATNVFGPQKGGRPEHLDVLDAALARYASVLKEHCGHDLTVIAGAGAAGGLGAGIVAFCGAVLQRGIDIVLDAVQFDEALKHASCVLTGEGRLDDQTRRGKVVDGVLAHASRIGVPVAAIIGSAAGAAGEIASSFGLADVQTLVDEKTTQAYAIRRAPELVAKRTAALMRRHVGPA